ncbi:MAG: heavy-metal-associated domain-containing protein [Halanaeroarchaeum sp.]
MSLTVTVTDMSCDGCEDIVENAVADVAGVESVTADRENEQVVVEGDANVEDVLEAIDFAGYTGSLGEEDEAEEPGEDEADDEADDEDETETADEDADEADDDEE